MPGRPRHPGNPPKRSGPRERRRTRRTWQFSSPINSWQILRRKSPRLDWSLPRLSRTSSRLTAQLPRGLSGTARIRNWSGLWTPSPNSSRFSPGRAASLFRRRSRLNNEIIFDTVFMNWFYNFIYFLNSGLV